MYKEKDILIYLSIVLSCALYSLSLLWRLGATVMVVAVYLYVNKPQYSYKKKTELMAQDTVG